MSFSQKIKQEILNQDFSPSNAIALITGLITVSGIRDGSKILLKFNRPEIFENVLNLLRGLKIDFEILKKNKNWITISEFNLQTEIKLPAFYFAGAFIGGGSISDPQSTNYHLEIQLYSHANANHMKDFLNKYSFNFQLIQRRMMFVLYIKKSEQISDFLRAIQCFNSLMEFEDTRISRDFQNHLNRYSNLDIHNQNKLAKTTQKFIKEYEFLVENKLLSNFRDEEINFFKLKIQNPYSSLEELAENYSETYDVKKTKSALNHWLRKMKKLVSEKNKEF